MEQVRYPSPEAEAVLARMSERRIGADPELEKQVSEILEAVKREGDDALLRYTRRFDAPELEARNLTVADEEIEAAYGEVDEAFLDSLRKAIENIEAFHKPQLPSSWFTARPDGTFLGQLVRPVASAGLYIPGGKGGETPLISSVLMNAIPARIAGVESIAMVTPPQRSGAVDAHLLVAARETGVTRVHRAGSAWAVAALAYGTASVAAVDVIVGPGNIFVTLAKKMVAGEVGIDLLAGPSEILVVADHRANPAYIAADLLSQAEHDAMSSAVLVTPHEPLAQRVLKELENQLAELPRQEVAKESLDRYGAAFLVEDLDAAMGLANRIAPEHLEIQTEDPWSCLGKIRNAGAVFLGDHTPEAVGDYFAGPNHVLPTAGAARFASALGVEHFLKKSSVLSYSKAALERDTPHIARLAGLEGLGAHARSVRLRT